MTEPLGVVLLADDDEDSRIIYSSALRHVGLEVHLARDGAEALALVGTHKPDVLLLDILMPAFSGHEVLQRLRSQAETRSLSVVAFTASNAGTVPELLARGYTSVLFKPVLPKRVIETVLELISPHATESSPSADPRLATRLPNRDAELGGR